jgi:hypothetical protein
LCAPYGNYCTPIIRACQGIFLWYSIGVRDKKPKLAMWMRRIFDAVKGVEKAIQENTKSIHSGEETNRNKPATTQPIQAVISFDDKTKGDTQAESNRQYGAQNSIRWAAWCAFGAATIYAGIAACQLREMRKATVAATTASAAADKANIDAETRFREDERPYVWFTPTGPGAPVFVQNKGSNPPTGQVAWEWHYTDYGKTPAYGIQWVYEEIKIGNRRPEIKLNRSYRVGVGTPLPPGKDDFAAVPSDPISPDEWPKLLSTDRSIQVRARVDYVSSDGTLYESGFCIARLASGATEYCSQQPNENYIKKLPQPN